MNKKHNDSRIIREDRIESCDDKDKVCEKLSELRAVLLHLTEKTHYVARSEYANIAAEYADVAEYFSVLEKSGMLDSYCKKNKIKSDDVRETVNKYTNIDAVIDNCNEEYIEACLVTEKNYLDSILADVDANIVLDEDQRRVILTDEDYCLVVAGAGAGKTTTVAAKVKYLVEKKNINPRDILVISFTNKAVGELREKINKDMGLNCPIATFHSTGNAVLHINNPEQLNIVDGSKLYYVILDYFKSAVLTNESLVNNLILFFASYFDAPYDGSNLNEFFNKMAKANFTTMRSELEEYKKDIIDSRTKKNVSIQNEVLKSYQEVEIANFLYLNNIDYEYEPIYPYNIAFARKPYTPDFVIKQGDKVAYIEHFGLSEDGKNNRYSYDEIERYKKCVNDKVRIHKEHGTTLIYTFSSYKDKREITQHLKDKLEKCGFDLVPKSNDEIMHKLISSEESRYIRRLVSLICRFITNFKTNGYSVDEFSHMYHSTKNVRSRLFLNICQDCYLEYERYLKENNAVDFEDMINESAKVLKEVKEMKQKLHFRYIIVDEYQDISRQRFDLTTALSEVTDAKIIAVGDDWQSIYAFSGSDISLFTKFKEKMGYAKLLKIVRTYRNAQDVIDIAGNFIQKNPSQIRKRLVSSKRIDNPVIIYTYDGTYKKSEDSRKTGALYALAKAVETSLDQIADFNRKEGREDDGTILLLGRYGFDGQNLERSGLFEFKSRGNKLKSVKYPKMDITFMTVHMSKGLGYDNVVVINGKNDTYGFPSKIEDDPVLSFVIKGDNSIDYAEERRLFYVAMTRTKNRVYFIAPEQNPSEFLMEIQKEYKSVSLKGSWNTEEIQRRYMQKACPVCGYPMQFRYKNAYGLRLHICTNNPEICGFMTNDIRAGKLSIIKCEKCRDGYMIAKPGRNNSFFLGCTNYRQDGKGCNNSISADDYYAQIGIEMNGVYFKEQNNITDSSNENVNVSDSNSEECKTKTRKKLLKPEIERITLESNCVNDDTITAIGAERSCDDNTEKYPDADKREILSNVINGLIHISEDRFFSRNVLVKVLKGSTDKEIQKYGLMNMPEYGSCSFMKTEDISDTVTWLKDNHLIIETKEYHPKLHVTYEGNHFDETDTRNLLKKYIKFLNDNDRKRVIEFDK